MASTKNKSSQVSSRGNSRSKGFVNSCWQVKCRGLSARGAALWSKGLWTDCEFRVGPGRELVSAHRVVLSSASPVFAAMLYGPLGSDRPHKIADITPDIFKLLLKYIYTDDIGNIRSCDIACKLFAAAEYFILPQLQTVCKAFLLSNICPYTVLRVYEFSVLFDEIEVMDRCLEVMRSQTTAVLSSSHITGVQPRTLASLLSLDSLAVKNELVLLQMLKSYALAHDYQLPPITSQNVSCQTIDSEDEEQVGREVETKDQASQTNHSEDSDHVVIDVEDEDSFSDIEIDVEESKSPGTPEMPGTPEVIVEEEEAIVVVQENEKENTEASDNKSEDERDSGYDTIRSSETLATEASSSANKKESENADIADVTITTNENNDADNNSEDSDNEELLIENGRLGLMRREIIDKDQGIRIMRKLVQQIRFLTIQPQQFAEFDTSCLLSDSERLAILLNMLTENSYVPMPHGFNVSKDSRAQDRKSCTFEAIVSVERKSCYKHFYVRNLSWYLKVQNKGKYLKISISCGNKTERLACRASLKFQLFSFKSGVGPIVHTADHLFSRVDEQMSYGWTVMEWDKMMNPKNGYVLKNSIRIGIHISAQLPSFDLDE